MDNLNNKFSFWILVVLGVLLMNTQADNQYSSFKGPVVESPSYIPLPHIMQQETLPQKTISVVKADKQAENAPETSWVENKSAVESPKAASNPLIKCCTKKDDSGNDRACFARELDGCSSCDSFCS